MKITVHWDRVIGLLLAIMIVIIAIMCFKIFNKTDTDQKQEIGQCDMHEAQKIIDNLVNKMFIFPF